MKKTVAIIVTVLVLALAGIIGYILRDLPQRRLLHAAENMVFTDAASAARLLAQVDTARLTDSSSMLYDLMLALVHEEQWYIDNADTASCLTASQTWSFNRDNATQKADDRKFPDDDALLRVYHYYEHTSLGGTSDDREALRRFGRICFVLSRHPNESILPLQTSQLFHLAIHCAETTDDHALAYRAYDRFADYLPHADAVKLELYLRRALEHYRYSPDHTCWLLTMLNDYGCAVLNRSPFDLHHFGSLVRITHLAAKHRKEPTSLTVLDSVYQSLDSLWALPHDDFSYLRAMGGPLDLSTMTEISVPVDMYEEVQQAHKTDETKHWQPSYESETRRAEQDFAINRDTYLAPGYVRKSAMLQRRLLTAAIIILVHVVLILLLVFRNWVGSVRRKREVEQATHQREAEQMAERLRQKDAAIALLRGHIIDKSEIVEMLEPKGNKRTIINARNWREIEMTLDTADNQFVSRLRAEHPQFSEDDIRLCMLTRLRLSNNALSAIYVISVSAVQHRKQKLKKEGFGITSPTVTFDQLIAAY